MIEGVGPSGTGDMCVRTCSAAIGSSPSAMRRSGELHAASACSAGAWFPAEGVDGGRADARRGGYLAEAEAAFQRGKVADYFLFPSGKLKGGSVPPGRATAA